MKAQQNKVNKANDDDDDVDDYDDDDDDEEVKPCPTPAGRRGLELTDQCCWPRSARPL